MDQEDTSKYNSIDHAKQDIAPGAKPQDWSSTSKSSTTSGAAIQEVPSDNKDGSITIGNTIYRDNTPRVTGSSFDDDIHGDTLPRTPTVLTGLLDAWPAYDRSDHQSWTIKDLATRTTCPVSLDGGPSFARMSMCIGKVTIQEYSRYCENDADGDSAPLYIFDPDILRSTFLDNADDNDDPGTTSRISDAMQPIPSCFSKDVMGCINGTDYRPLPPAWLLLGAARSGTPIHNHPLTVAWNALLVGCKLWCCLPPDIDESLLLLNLLDDEEDFDLSAIDWFHQCCTDDLPPSATIIVQRPGEVVYLPHGWFHVVLNVETSTAISVSLALRRDLDTVLPLLMDSDKEFAQFWVDRLLTDGTTKCAREEISIHKWIPSSMHNLASSMPL